MEKQNNANTDFSGAMSLEDFDDAFREIDELLDDWNKRLTVNDLSLSE